MSAILLNVKKADTSNDNYDYACSKFFGSPVIPGSLLDELKGELLFLMQIRLSDLASLDKDNILPHEGYLYFFIDVSEGEYNLRPVVKYSNEELDTIVDDFNDQTVGFEEFVNEYEISFSECDDDSSGLKLLGVPNDWNYEGDSPKLLFQFDPLASDMGLFSYLDGFIYFFFGDDEKDFSQVEIFEEYS